MKPFLKKICRERGQEPKPSTWQAHGGQGEKCPNCKKPLFRQTIYNQITFKCHNCNKFFERDSWTKFKEVKV